MSSLEHRARTYAAQQHSGQIRKYTNEPYIIHPANVVDLVRTVPHDEEMIAAAWLHDVVEDTDATLTDIFHRFGPDVAELVEMLTDVSCPEDGNRAARKAIDREHTAGASRRAQTIKLADLIDNSRDILAHDPNFAKVYLKEKDALLSVLLDGDTDLWWRAFNVVYCGRQALLSQGTRPDTSMLSLEGVL